MKKEKKELFRSKSAKKLMKKSDDFILTSRPMSVIYENGPKELADLEISVLELHVFPKGKKKALLKWLNRKG